MTKLLSPVSEDRAIVQRLQSVIRSHSANSPRSKQVNIGPSEIGVQCARRLAYRLLDWTRTNDSSDPWPSISGTALHAWLADAFAANNADADWLVEHRVTIRQNLSGSLDLFHRPTGTVIDHKCVGNTSMKARKADGPTHQQLVQLNLYALGLELQGETVKKVALAFYPLGGSLNGMHVWVSDYDSKLALDALARLDTIKDLVVALDPEEDSSRWNLIPAVATSCSFCPFYLPGSTDLSQGCPGASS